MLPWIEAMAKSYPGLEELRLKRMVVSDESLELLSRAFPNFKALVLVSCEGFTTDGLASIAANCRSVAFLLIVLTVNVLIAIDNVYCLFHFEFGIL